MKVHGIIMWPIPNFMNVIYLTTCVVRKENVKWIFQIIMNSILSLFYQMLLICQKLLWRKLLGTYLQGNNNWALESDLARKHINGKNMEYLKTAMATLIFNIFICCKWLATNHKQVLWLSCNSFWCVVLRMKNAICNMFNDSLLISCKLFTDRQITIWALKQNSRMVYPKMQCLIIWYHIENLLHLYIWCVLNLRETWSRI